MTITAVCGAIVRPPAIIAVALSLVGCDLAGPTPFDSTAWRNGEVAVANSDDAPRLRIADGLVKDEVLIGKSKAQIEALLGPPTQTEKFSNYGLVYWLGPERGPMSIDSEWLVVTFDGAGIATDVDVTRD